MRSPVVLAFSAPWSSSPTVRVLVDFHSHAGTAGGWMYQCHLLEHAEGGMLAEVRVGES